MGVRDLVHRFGSDKEPPVIDFRFVAGQWQFGRAFDIRPGQGIFAAVAGAGKVIGGGVIGHFAAPISPAAPLP